MSGLLLLAHIGGRKAAFRAQDIGSIVELTDIVPVPRAPDFIAGLAALRSKALTVIDSRKALGLPAPAAAADGRAPVVEIDGYSYALLVDRVEDIASAIGEPAPLPATLGSDWTRIAHGLVETSAGPAILVDVTALIAGPRAAQPLK